ncbi:MAG: recombinase family protein [Microlunatus sp.]|nr:recombinase family protein [Microlunatus sp.]
MNTVFAYLRRSRVLAGDTSLSMAVQEEACRDWAVRQYGPDVRVVVFQDSNVSGGKMSRPEFDRMRARIGEADAVVSAKLDQIARSMSGLSEFADECLSAGVRLATANGQLDVCTNDPMSKFTLGILGLVAELELSLISERLASGKAASAEAGRWQGGIPPFGWSVQEHPEGGAVLVVDPDEQAVIAELLDRRENGATWRELVRWMQSNVPSRRGGKWTATGLQGVLSNEKLRDVLGPAGYSRAKRLAAVNPGGKARKASRLLSGVALCAGCGRPMRVQRDDKRGNAPRYQCKTIDCTERTAINADELDALIVDRFLGTFGDLEERVIRTQTDLNADRLQELQDQEQEITDSLGVLDDDKAVAAIAERKRIRAEIASMAEESASSGLIQVGTGRTITEAFKDNTLDGQRRLLLAYMGSNRLTVERSRYRGDRTISERIPGELFITKDADTVIVDQAGLPMAVWSGLDE